MFGKPSTVSGPYRISGIRHLPDIRYPAFGLAGYPAGRISGNNSIRCIPNSITILIFTLYWTIELVGDIGTKKACKQHINHKMNKVKHC
jgi:hypothetical protein